MAKINVSFNNFRVSRVTPIRPSRLPRGHGSPERLRDVIALIREYPELD